MSEHNRSERDVPPDATLSQFAWPPPHSRMAPQVVDLRTDTILSVEEATGVSSGEGLTTPSPAEQRRVESPPPMRAATISRIRRQPTRLAVFLLLALAAVEALVIAWQSFGRPVPGVAALSNASGGAEASVPPTTTSPGDVLLPVLTQAPKHVATAGAAAAGALQVRTDGRAAAVFVDDRRRGTTPLTVSGLAPGPHRVRVVSGAVSVTQTVTVQPGSASTLLVPLGIVGPQAGWVDVVLPFEVDILEEGQLVGTSAQRRLQFPAGEHRFMLVNEALGYRALERVLVRHGEVATLRPDVPTGRLHINALPWAEVLIDGRPAGTTPLANVPAALGTREVRFRHPDLGEQTRQVVVTALEPARVGVELGR